MKKMKKLISILFVFLSIFLIVLLIFSLTGCAGMHGQFDCNVNSGGSCLAMDQINQLADTGVFNREQKSKAQIWLAPDLDENQHYQNAKKAYVVVNAHG